MIKERSSIATPKVCSTNAFLDGDLLDEVYMFFPLGHVKPFNE